MFTEDRPGICFCFNGLVWLYKGFLFSKFISCTSGLIGCSFMGKLYGRYVCLLGFAYKKR